MNNEIFWLSMGMFVGTFMTLGISAIAITFYKTEIKNEQ